MYGMMACCIYNTSLMSYICQKPEIGKISTDAILVQTYVFRALHTRVTADRFPRYAWRLRRRMRVLDRDECYDCAIDYDFCNRNTVINLHTKIALLAINAR